MISRPTPGASLALVLCLAQPPGGAAQTPSTVQSPDAASRWTARPGPEAVVGVETRAVAAGPDGSVWVAIRDQGLVRLRRGEAVSASGGGPGELGVAHLRFDAAGRLWASGRGGYAVLEPEGWTVTTSAGPLEPRVVFATVTEPGTGALWLATSGGAARLEDGVWTIVGADDGLPHAVVHDVVVDAGGTLWFASRTGLARAAGGAPTSVEIVRDGLNVRSASAGPDGVLWFGTSEGLLVGDGTNWRWALVGRTVVPVLHARDGAVWAGTAGGDLHRHADGRWSAVALPSGYEGAEIFDLAEDADGRVWVATSAGAAVVGRPR